MTSHSTVDDVRRRRVRAGWLNFLGGTSFALAALAYLAAFAATGHLATPAVALLLGVGAWRMWRCGVYATGKGIVVRQVFLTRRLSWDRVVGVTPFEVRRLDGITTYMPGIVYRHFRPYHVSSMLPAVGQTATTRTIRLWMHPAMTETGMERITQRLVQLIEDGHRSMANPEADAQGATRVGP